MSKMGSLRVATLLNSIAFVVLCFALREGIMYVEGAVEMRNTTTSLSTSPAPPAVTTPSMDAETTDSEGYPTIPIPKSEQYTNTCRASLMKYVYTAIVAHNMNVLEARVLHRKNDGFEELAQNISNTIMLFADQVGKMMYMFNTCTEPQIDVTVPVPEPVAAPPDHSEITVLSLLVVILAMSCYIGYLSYKLKTKYYHNSSILIEEHH